MPWSPGDVGRVPHPSAPDTYYADIHLTITTEPDPVTGGELVLQIEYTGTWPQNTATVGYWTSETTAETLWTQTAIPVYDSPSYTVTVTMPASWALYFGSTNAYGGIWETRYTPGDSPPEPVPGSASTIIPVLLGDIADLPTDVVATTTPTAAVNTWAAAADIADRSEIRLVDRGSGWEALPALPTPGSVVLTIEAGVNLISADSIVDIDQADWAQSALVVYTWPEEWDDNPEDGTPGIEITRRQIAWSSPQYGTDTLIERRDGIPATEAQAQTVADVLGARAWLRGHALEVTTVCCAWVRVADTVTVDLPWAPAADYWVAEARHDSQAATSTLTLRSFDLTYYPDA